MLSASWQNAPVCSSSAALPAGGGATFRRAASVQAASVHSAASSAARISLGRLHAAAALLASVPLPFFRFGCLSCSGLSAPAALASGALRHKATIFHTQGEDAQSALGIAHDLLRLCELAVWRHLKCLYLTLLLARSSFQSGMSMKEAGRSVTPVGEFALQSERAASSCSDQSTACCRADAPVCCHMLSGAASDAAPEAADTSSVVSCRCRATLQLGRWILQGLSKLYAAETSGLWSVDLENTQEKQKLHEYEVCQQSRPRLSHAAPSDDYLIS